MLLLLEGKIICIRIDFSLSAAAATRLYVVVAAAKRRYDIGPLGNISIHTIPSYYTKTLRIREIKKEHTLYVLWEMGAQHIKQQKFVFNWKGVFGSTELLVSGPYNFLNHFICENFYGAPVKQGQ